MNKYLNVILLIKNKNNYGIILIKRNSLVGDWNFIEYFPNEKYSIQNYEKIIQQSISLLKCKINEVLLIKCTSKIQLDEIDDLRVEELNKIITYNSFRNYNENKYKEIDKQLIYVFNIFCNDMYKKTISLK